MYTNRAGINTLPQYCNTTATNPQRRPNLTSLCTTQNQLSMHVKQVTVDKTTTTSLSWHRSWMRLNSTKHSKRRGGSSALLVEPESNAAEHQRNTLAHVTCSDLPQTKSNVHTVHSSWCWCHNYSIDSVKTCGEDRAGKRCTNHKTGSDVV
jgi:hypothetical protein